jgi:hypothetical protein
MTFEPRNSTNSEDESQSKDPELHGSIPHESGSRCDSEFRRICDLSRNSEISSFPDDAIIHEDFRLNA